MKNRIIAIFFCVALLSGVVAGIICQDRYYSESERRTLTQLPDFSISSLFAGKFADELEKYLSDQFPARDSWITAKTIAERTLGKRESGGVYFAEDGYLIDKFSSLDSERFKKNIAALKAFSEKVKALDIPVKTMLVPTAVEILSDKLPPFAPKINQQSLIDYAKSQGLKVVDPASSLRDHNNEYIYYKTDHHYTSLGAYYCYCAWKQSKGEAAEPISAWKKEILCDNFRGTSYAKVNYPFSPYDEITAYYKNEKHTVNYNSGDYIADSIYERKHLAGKDQYAVFLNSNQAQTVVKGAGNGKLLIIKDSYANTFAQFVIDDYEETHLIDMRFYKKSVSEYIIENGITEVLILYNIPNFASDMNVSYIR